MLWTQSLIKLMWLALVPSVLVLGVEPLGSYEEQTPMNGIGALDR